MTQMKKQGPIRVLQLINRLEVGGAEKLLADLAPLIDRTEGFTCEVLVLGKPGNTIFEKALGEKGVTVRFLGNSGMYALRIVRQLARQFGKYDVVHVHLFPSQLWAVLAGFFVRRKVVLVSTEHSTNNRRRQKPVFRILDRFIYKRYNSVVSISEDARRTLLEWLEPRKDIAKYCVIPNGVDIANIQDAAPVKRQSLGVPRGAFLCLCVGRLEEVKNHKMQIEAISRLDERFHLVCAGDGSLRQELGAYASRLQVADRVHFLGVRADIPALVRSADAVLLTSHWEGLSLACIEGMSCCPLIGTDVNGIRDVVEGAGILVSDGDADALQAEIRRLSEDAGYYERTREACRIRALQFDIGRTRDRYLALYGECLGYRMGESAKSF